MKYILLLLLASNLSASECFRLPDIINLYNVKSYEHAKYALTNRCGEQKTWDAYEAYWYGKVYEANGDTYNAMQNYEFVWKLKRITEDSDPNLVFFKSSFFPEAIYRLCKLYLRYGPKKDYEFMTGELKKLSTKYYWKVVSLQNCLFEDEVKKFMEPHLMDADKVTGIKMQGEFIKVTTDSKHPMDPSPQIDYYLKRIGGKLRIVHTAPMMGYEDVKYSIDDKDIPRQLLEWNPYR